MPLNIDFAELFERSPNPYMLLDRDLNFVAANEAYLQVTSSRRESIIGRNVFDAFPADPADPRGSGITQLRRSLERVLSEKRADTLALIRYKMAREGPDGVVLEDRFWSATHTPILDEDGEVRLILQHTVDVTELQQTKKALRAAEVALDQGDVPAVQVEEGVFRRAQVVQEVNERLSAERGQLRRLFEQAPGFVAVLDGPKHVFELANVAYYQLVGHREILGKPAIEALPEVEGQGFFDLLDHVYASGEPYVGREVELLIQRDPGGALEERYVDFLYQPIFEADGSVSGIFVQGHDVTEQRTAREELTALNESLERRVQERTSELEARNRELQEFAYVASHDLQEPLRKVHSFSDILVAEYGDVVGQQGRWYFERIQSATRRMSALIKDLLVYSRIATHVNPYRRTDLNEILRDVLFDLQLRVEETGAEVHVDDDLPEIECDPVQLRQLFQNLIANALKFHIPGQSPVIDVTAEDAPSADGRAYHRFIVSDNGIGFPQQYASKVFMPFQRLHPQNKYAGTGIGLAICRRIVERHGGCIDVTSEPGRGSRFTVILPARQSVD